MRTGHFLVPDNAFRWYSVLPHQVLQKYPQAVQLVTGRIINLKIANEAYSNPPLVEFTNSRMSTDFLLRPSTTDLDLSVRGLRTVSDHKMVAQGIPAFVPSVVAIERSRAAFSCGAVVDYDPFPIPRSRLPRFQ